RTRVLRHRGPPRAPHPAAAGLRRRRDGRVPHGGSPVGPPSDGARGLGGRARGAWVFSRSRSPRGAARVCRAFGRSRGATVSQVPAAPVQRSEPRGAPAVWLAPGARVFRRRQRERAGSHGEPFMILVGDPCRRRTNCDKGSWTTSKG